MKSALAMSAPSHRVTVTVFAFTKAQAERIKAQVSHMFTGHDVSIEPNSAPLAAAPGDEKTVTALRAANPSTSQPQTVNLLEDSTSQPEARPAAGAGTAPGAPDKPVIPAPFVPQIFSVGDMVSDRHVADRTLKVTAIDDNGFTLEDNSRCPWISADCYEKLSGKKAAAKVEKPETTSDGAKSEGAAAVEPGINRVIRSDSTAAKPAAKRTAAKNKPGAPKDRATLTAVKRRHPAVIGAHKPKHTS